MKRLLVSQRVDLSNPHQERRDALDQRWTPLLLESGLLPILVPNNPDWLQFYLANEPLDGILLTGGNTLGRYGGDAPERDLVERMLIQYAVEQQQPLLGVCRGMQQLLDYFGAELEPVKGHVKQTQTISIDGQPEAVNSYHDWGCYRLPPCLQSWAVADDGVIKAIRHRQHPICGLMWHPERMPAITARDRRLLQQLFGVLNA